jgi:hypothetical protein
VKLAICDPDAFYPLERLVRGPFENVNDLLHVERFLRTVVLHDEITLEMMPVPDLGKPVRVDRASGRMMETGEPPVAIMEVGRKARNRLRRVP